MKRIKKFLGVFLALAMVLGMVGMMPAMEAKATATGETEVTVEFDYKSQRATITSTTSPNYLYVGFIKKSEDTEPKSWDVFPYEDGMDIDLSAYAKKGVILEFKTDTDVTVVRREFAGNNAVKVKPKYVPNGKPTATTSPLEYFTFNAEVTPDIKSKLEFRLSTSEGWTPYTTDDVKAAIDQASFYGATIYFRIEGSNTATDKKFLFASAESKAKIAKSGNAPKVKVDYSKLTVTIPKGVMLLNNSSFVPKATETTTVSLTATDFTGNNCILADGFTIYVQTAATDKKPASKIGYVKIEAQAEVLTAGALESKSEESKIEFTNKAGKAIEYVLASGADAATALASVDITAKTTKFKKIAAGGKVTFKATDAGKYLIIRVPAETDKTTKITTPASVLFTDETFKVVLKAAPDDEDETPTDTTAPVLTDGNKTLTAIDDVKLTFKSDEAGTYYYMVLESSASSPNASTIIEQGTAVCKGTAATVEGVNTISIESGLSEETGYKAYIVVKDASGNISDVLPITGIFIASQ